MTSADPGRLMMVDFEGTQLTPEVARHFKRLGVQAVCLFRKNLGSEQSVRTLLRDLRDALGPQALIGIDQEGGAVMRAEFLPHAPSAMALGALSDPQDTAAKFAEQAALQTGAAVARGLASLGINWNFAPVADVNNNPRNPVIAERSFGADPQRVALLARAWMQGALQEGVACCLKHFPGHGDTHVDSHHQLPYVDKSLAQLEQLELVPFRQLASQAPAMMTAHIVYPQLDPDVPATLSRRILTDLLRERFGFQGVLITDSLMMQAVQSRFGYERAAIMALQAGADMVLCQGHAEQQVATWMALDAARHDKTLRDDDLALSAQRLEHLAKRFPCAPRPYLDELRLQDDARMSDYWARSLTTVRGAQPPSRRTPLRVVTQSAVPSDGVAEMGVGYRDLRSLFDGFDDVEWVEVDDLVHFDPRELPQDQRRLMLVSNHRHRYDQTAGWWHPEVHVVLWNPYQAQDIAAPSVLTWGFSRGALSALDAWFSGQLHAGGHLPIPLV